MFLGGLGPNQDMCPVFCGNEAALLIAKDEVDTASTRGKYIDIRYFFVKDHYKWGYIDLLLSIAYWVKIEPEW